MLYHVTLGGRTYRVELVEGRVCVDGEEFGETELAAVPGTPVHHLLVAGRSHTLVAGAGEKRGWWDLHVDGVHHTVEVVDERTRVIRSLTRTVAGPQGPKPVRAPMPGLVVRVEVGPGQRVTPGQGVVIMEAMKMENELRAEGGGVVSRVLVAAGQPVEKGTVLIEFEADGA
jgi:pyruvate carboxylase subunit B